MQNPSLFRLRKGTKILFSKMLLTSKGMEDEESLKTVGLVSKPLHSVHSHLKLQIIARTHGQILDSHDDPVKEIENKIPQSAPFPQCSGPVRSYWQHPRDKPSNCGHFP